MGEGEGEEGEVPDSSNIPMFVDCNEDEEDDWILKSDAIIVTATAENDYSNLEIYVYEMEKNNLYVHHEIILSAYPLCLEWMPITRNEEEKGNFIAVGTFMP